MSEPAEPLVTERTSPIEQAESAGGILNLIIGIVPAPARPAVRWGLGACALVGVAIWGFLWLDGRVDEKIGRISTQAIEAKATASEKAVDDMHAQIEDHEKRLTQNAADVKQVASDVSDIRGDMKAIRQMLDDRLPAKSRE